MTRGSHVSGPSFDRWAGPVGVLLVLVSGCAREGTSEFTKGEATLFYEGKQAKQEVSGEFGAGLSSGTKAGRTLVIRVRSADGEEDLGEVHSIWFTATFDRAFNEGSTPVMESCAALASRWSTHAWVELPCEGEVVVTNCLDFEAGTPAVSEYLIDYYLSARFELTMKKKSSGETWTLRDGTIEVVFAKTGSSPFEE